MKNFIIHFTIALCLFAADAFAQEDKKDQRENDVFENQALLIGNRIDAITKEEKAALKEEIEAVNKELEAGTITREQADQKKLELAQSRANKIETRVAVEQEKLNQLVKDKVDGKLIETDSTRTFIIRFTNKKRKREETHGESRTTSQFVFAAGVNNVVTDGAVANSDFRYWGSHFYEWGVSWNSRIFKNDNLLHAKYGLSFQYNNLRATDNRYFEENGDQTNLVTSPVSLRESRFRNVNLVVPVHLEFDFTKKKMINDKPAFLTHNAFRFGIGGYAGVNIKSKQILKFDDQDGNKVTQKTKGDFNVNDLIYGLSAYVGYEEVSLYVKYDLNPIFEDNAVSQRNVSLGVRFDFN